MKKAKRVPNRIVTGWCDPEAFAEYRSGNKFDEAGMAILPPVRRLKERDDAVRVMVTVEAVKNG